MSSIRDKRVLVGPVFATFIHYVVPSLVGLVAISTASIVDGIFVGRYVGPDALAAVTLLIPYFTLIFAISLMMAVGGSVRAGRYLGEGRVEAASAIFSKSVIAVCVFTALAGVLSNQFDQLLFAALGVPESLDALVQSYFQAISIALVVQSTSLVVYYFVRLDGKPILATGALVFGAVTNIVLNALFVAQLGWGLRGAALATGLSQLLQLSVLSSHFLLSKQHLKFSVIQRDWGELRRSAYNGASEFVNEVSAGLVMLLLNWLMVKRVGVEGVSAFALINFAIFASLMIFYGISDAVHLLVSQNLGAGNASRIRAFMRSAVGCVACLSSVFCLALVGLGQYWFGLFLEESSRAVREQASAFLGIVWPLFLVNGMNVLATVYLAAMHQPLPAGLLALARSLVLPSALLVVLATFAPGVPFLLALPLAEWTTFCAAAWLLVRFRPESCVDRDARREQWVTS